jgi:pimeloyl-ACP methyl ester carboxylesterase
VPIRLTDSLSGGPGGSGIELVQVLGTVWQQLIGTQHNLIGFDPRGVGNSGPIVDCFPGHPGARAHYEDIFYSDVSNASSTALDTQFYSADLFGSWCTQNVGGRSGNASFVSTPAVAHDMLTYAMAEQKAAGKPAEEAKVSYYGTSYGTVLGATFASLFPDNVGRVVLDGVVDAEDYYNLGWSTNLYQTDEALQSFSLNCYQSGQSNCSFWGPSTQNISDRLDQIVMDLKYHPIPVPQSAACPLPMLATYSDLKQLLLLSLYNPLDSFPLLSDILLSLEQGNGSAIMAPVRQWGFPADPCNNGSAPSSDDIGTIVKCVDGFNGTHLSTVEEYRGYLDVVTNQSKFFGEVWTTNANGVSCRTVEVQPPKSGRLPGILHSFTFAG